MVKKLTILYVLEPFLLNQSEKLHLSDIARRLKEPHPTVRKHLNFLEGKGLLKKSTKGRLTLYELNVENKSLVNYLVVAEKNKLIHRCEKELVLKELVSVLHFTLDEHSSALIFGSGTESLKKANDVDLLITGKFDKERFDRLCSHLNLKIHLINVKNLKSVNEALKDEIRKSHLLIQGSEQLVRWLFW